jgi:hypothetical protein
VSGAKRPANMALEAYTWSRATKLGEFDGWSGTRPGGVGVGRGGRGWGCGGGDGMRRGGKIEGGGILSTNKKNRTQFGVMSDRVAAIALRGACSALAPESGGRPLCASAKSRRAQTSSQKLNAGSEQAAGGASEGKERADKQRWNVNC